MEQSTSLVSDDQSPDEDTPYFFKES